VHIRRIAPPAAFLLTSDFQKFHLTPNPNHFYIRGRPAPQEGRFAIVTNAGRDAVDAGCATDESTGLRTAKACGPDTSVLVSSRREETFSLATVARKPITGEITL
jgi:hypothetical protein